MASTSHQPTFFEKLDLIPAHLSVIGAVLYAAIAAPFRGNSGADTYLHHITHSAVRKLLSRMNTAQLQYIAPSFQTVYEKWCKSKKLQPEIVSLKSGCKAFWVGDKTATNVVIYFHGGGFSLDGGEEHLNYWYSVQRDMTKSNKSIAFLFVAYRLVPYATYPAQLVDGIEALNYVLNDLGRSPGDILLAGDSAGGNMCLGILSHLSHPISELPEVNIATKLRALVLLAPWVTFKTDFSSGRRNKYKDMITKETAVKWGGDYLRGQPTSPYAEPLEASPDWWSNPKVEQLLAVAGADEMLADPITEWVEKYKVSHSPLGEYLEDCLWWNLCSCDIHLY